MGKSASDKLAATFSSSSSTQIQQLRKQLKHLSKGNESIDTYMKKAKSIHDQLSALQSPVPEDALISDIMKGLGPAYRPFIRAIEGRNSPFTYDELYALLLSEECQLKMDSMSIDSSLQPSAQVATKSQNNSICRFGTREGRGCGKKYSWCFPSSESPTNYTSNDEESSLKLELFKVKSFELRSSGNGGGAGGIRGAENGSSSNTSRNKG